MELIFNGRTPAGMLSKEWFTNSVCCVLITFSPLKLPSNPLNYDQNTECCSPLVNVIASNPSIEGELWCVMPNDSKHVIPTVLAALAIGSGN